MGSSKSKSTTKSSTVQKQDTWTPGTEYAKTNMENLKPFAQDWVTPTSYTGQRFALPAEFTPGTQTFAQEGIDAGMAGAGNVQARSQPIVNNLYDYWGNITAGGGENPYTQDVINSWTTDFNQQAQRAANRRALTAGAEGAFGGSAFNQGEAWAAEEEAQAYARTLADLRYQDFLNTQQLMMAAPSQLGQIAQAQNLPAEMYGYWGGQRNQNAREAQDRLTEREQLGLDENYVRWLSGQEGIDTALARAQGLQGIYASAPGQSSYGTQDTKSTTTTKSTPSPGQVAASIGGAALGMFAPGGLFAASSAFKPLAGLSRIAPMATPATTALSPLTYLPQFGIGGS